MPTGTPPSGTPWPEIGPSPIDRARTSCLAAEGTGRSDRSPLLGVGRT
jgi:hypothetical protein